MDQETFVAELKANFEKGFIDRYGPIVHADEALFRAALGMGDDPDPRLAFRASYTVEWAFLHGPEKYAGYVPQIVENFLTVRNRSAQRHYTKLMAFLLRNKRVNLSAEMQERCAERAFDLLIDGETPVAVRVWTMDILEELSAALPWIAAELDATIGHMLADGSAGLMSRGVKIRRRLAGRLKNNDPERNTAFVRPD